MAKFGVFKDKDISTHTLTWSVTFDISTIKAPYDISTHTLTWSVTADRGKITPAQYISTHTLTWSVTPQTQGTPSQYTFQLTRSRGA